MTTPVLFVKDHHHTDYYHVLIDTDERRRKGFTTLVVGYCGPDPSFGQFNYFHKSVTDMSKKRKELFETLMDAGEDAWKLNAPDDDTTCLAEWLVEDFDRRGFEVAFEVITPEVVDGESADGASGPLLFIHNKRDQVFYHYLVDNEERRRKTFTFALTKMCSPGSRFDFFHPLNEDCEDEQRDAFRSLLDAGEDAWKLDSPEADGKCLAEWITTFREDYDHEIELPFWISVPTEEQ